MWDYNNLSMGVIENYDIGEFQSREIDIIGNKHDRKGE